MDKEKTPREFGNSTAEQIYYDESLSQITEKVNICDENNIRIINMADVAVQEVDWLLYPLIPYGKITIIQGDPGEGKTTFVLRLIAALTTGKSLMDDDNETGAFEPVNVIYQNCEDGLGDTIKPRLLDAGANCSRVVVIDDRETEPLTMKDTRIEAVVAQTKAKLLVLDPIQGYLGSDIDMHRANEIRPVMKHLSDIAEKYNCAVILVGHMNKCSQAKAAYKGLGSIDFAAAARSVLLVGRIKNEPNIRVVCQIKNSLAPEAVSIAFELDEESGFKWIGEYDITADDLLEGKNKSSKQENAVNFLSEQLSKGRALQTEVQNEAEKAEISYTTLKRAKKELGVVSKKIDNKWYWELP